jgi:hypothetical protein
MDPESMHLLLGFPDAVDPLEADDVVDVVAMVRGEDGVVIQAPDEFVAVLSNAADPWPFAVALARTRQVDLYEVF